MGQRPVPENRFLFVKERKQLGIDVVCTITLHNSHYCTIATTLQHTHDDHTLKGHITLLTTMQGLLSQHAINLQLKVSNRYRGQLALVVHLQTYTCEG